MNSEAISDEASSGADANRWDHATCRFASGLTLAEHLLQMSTVFVKHRCLLYMCSCT